MSYSVKMGKNGKSAAKKIRQEEAKERQAAYDKLSLTEKLTRLGPTGSKKQRAKLTSMLAKEKPAEDEAEVVKSVKPKKAAKK